MEYKSPGFIIHGGDYNPEQWINTPGIWDEDMRLMKLANMNSATIGIFSWAMLEPEEGKYDFGWLDKIMDMLYENGIGAILATPSGARPQWLAQKYPEVLRVEESGIRNEYGVRHNHCLTSPVYREKARKINTALAERYKNHPALKMWHISNEYSGECHCKKCTAEFRKWLKNYYYNDLNELNAQWWSGFWAHTVTDWEQINSPKSRGENHVPALKLAWRRFVSDSHISFYENEIAPLREITPDIPVTTNFMRMYDGINYQDFAKHVDIISWDNYPAWDEKDNKAEALKTAFVHDVFRSMKDGQPFLMMESTPSLVNWHDVNKLPRPGMQELSAIQAIAHGADSVQYFQWRKSRGGHEKYHGAVVDHTGSENTRVFIETAHAGEVFSKLSAVTDRKCHSKIAVIYDWENDWAVKGYCGYNNIHRDYLSECIKWYEPFYKRGISADIISMDDDFSAYSLIIAPYLYMLKDGTEDKIEKYVAAGGHFIGTYLTGVTNKNDLCYLGGIPAGKLKDVFGIHCEETDALPETVHNTADFLGKTYEVSHICDIICADTAEILGRYSSDFYAGTPAVTENRYKNGTAYYAAFRSDSGQADDICEYAAQKAGLSPDVNIGISENITVRKRGEYIFIMNFSDGAGTVTADKTYTDILTGTALSGEITVQPRGYLILG